MGDGKTVHVSLSSPCVLCLRAERHVSLGQDSLLREKRAILREIQSLPGKKGVWYTAGDMGDSKTDSTHVSLGHEKKC